MKAFLDDEFLLETDTAQHLFHDYAESLPLIDYHSHIPPREVWEDRRFENLAQIWLGGKENNGGYFGDHYKWRLMRANGADEADITGNTDDYRRFFQFVGALEKAIGNPMYHWCHLELRRYFGYSGVLNRDSAREVWELCNDRLQNDPAFTVRGILKKSNVAMIGTTDDPADSLEWHKKLAADSSLSCKIYPSFRPDRAVNIQKADFAEYLGELARSVGLEQLDTLGAVKDALTKRLEFFKSLGCRASDHGLDYVPFRPVPDAAANAALQKALKGEALTREEAEGWQTAILLHLGREYRRLGIVMQLHYNCVRNPNSRMLQLLGPDTGFDCMGGFSCADALYGLLDALDSANSLPRTILYSLNPADDPLLDTMIGAFQGSEVPGKLQHGAAWWFNDTRGGMERQLRSLASLGILGNFVGMLTDSRSFLSYPRHEYFRRIFCNLLGRWVENGEYPNDERALREIVEGVCYQNAVRYFAL